MKLLVLSISTIFINNLVLSQLLGLCPFLGGSKKMDTVLGLGFAVTFVITLSCMTTYLVNNFLLIPLGIGFLRIVVIILVIASMVMILENMLKKTIPGLYNILGIYFPLITTNCAVLGTAFILIEKEYDFISSAVFGFSAGISYLLVLFLMASIREKLDLADVPNPFKGIPIAFITAGLMALAFLAVDQSMINSINP